jgi:nucleoredoxin
MASFAVAQDLFGESTTELRKQNGTVSVQQAFAGKEVIALYFSASWCGPCKRFTPMLVDVYNLLKSQGRGFEVVFVSGELWPRCLAVWP